jgi:hypothetical protein
MEIEITAFGMLFFATLAIGAKVVKRRRDVLHGPFIERGFSKRFAAIAAL